MGQLNDTSMSTVIAGIDIGGTKVAAILIDNEGKILARGAGPAPAGDGGPAMADAATNLVTRLVAESGTHLRAAGVGAAGVIDANRGVIRAASTMFTDWAGFALADSLRLRLRVPVRVENDVNAFLMGEVAGSDTDGDVLGIMLGTGVGGAVMLGGELRHGPNGSAGEIGHTPGYSDIVCTCGQVGHLETVASGISIGLRYGESTGVTGLDARQVVDRARGETRARERFSTMPEGPLPWLGQTLRGCSTWVRSSSVEVTLAWDLLDPAITATLGTDSPVSGVPLRINRARLGADAVALGAAASARTQFMTRSIA